MAIHDVLCMCNTTLTSLKTPFRSLFFPILRKSPSPTAPARETLLTHPIALPNPPTSTAASWKHGKSSKPGRARAPPFKRRNDSELARRFVLNSNFVASVVRRLGNLLEWIQVVAAETGIHQILAEGGTSKVINSLDGNSRVVSST
jgi:hypothetical protein